MVRKREARSAEFKAKVAFAAVAERQTVAELVEKFALKVDAGKVREIIEEMASTYQDPEEVINWYYSNQEQLASVQSRVLEDQMVEKLLGNAQVVEKPCSYQEALAQGQRGD